MSTRTRIDLLALALTATAFALRLFHIDLHNLRGDEAFSITFTQGTVAAIIEHLTKGEPHPPLYYLGLKWWLGLAGLSELAARWPSAAGDVLVVPLSYAFCRRLRAPSVGLLAAALVAANPFQLWNSQDARMYALATGFSAAGLYWGARAAGVGRPARAFDYYGLAASSLLALYTHYATAFLLFAIDAFILVRWLLGRCQGTIAFRPWVASQALVAALYLPWLAVAIGALGPSYAGTQQSPGWDAALRDTLVAFTSGGMLSGPEAEWLAAGTALAVLLGLAGLVFRQRAAGGLLLVFVVVPFVALFVASRSRPVFSARYLMPVSPAVGILAAYGIAGLAALHGKWTAGKVLSWLLAGVLFAAVALPTADAVYSYYKDRGGDGFGTWREYAAAVVSLAGPQDLVIINHLDPSFIYYYKRLGGVAEQTTSPPAQGLRVDDLDKDLFRLVTPGRTVWLVPDAVRMWDKDGIVRAWLDKHTVKMGVSYPGKIELVEYRMPGGRQVNASFGGLLTLERCEVRQGESGLPPGSDVVVDLVWHASVPISIDYTVSLQLLDSAGHLVAQADGQPVNGRVPTSSWRTGEPIIDTRTLHLPAVPGSYKLGVVVYALPSAQRLPVPGGSGDWLPLGDIGIGR